MTKAPVQPVPLPAVVPFQRLTLVLALISFAVCLVLGFTAQDPFYLAPFRESQTAISAYYLLHEPAGGLLAYQIPVLGLPWQLPLEFPVFQQLTAWLAACGVEVAQAGRIMSLIGFLGCLLAGAKIWRDCQLPARWQWVAVALFAASPIYSCYAISHMIESWALLPSLIMIWCAFRFARPGGWLWLAGLALAASLSAMIKITTWLPAAFLVSVLLLAMLREIWRKRAFKAGLPRWIGAGTAMAAGLAAGLVWTIWAAHVRAAHGSDAGGSDQWIFGTLAVRLSIKNWLLVAAKDLLLLFGPLGLLVPFLLVAAWWKGGGSVHPLNRCMAFGLSGYLIHALAFITLLTRHDYYVFGSGVFLLFATVCAVIVLVESVNSVWVRLLPPALAVSMMFGMLVYDTTKRGYRDYAVDQAIEAVARVKEPGAVMTFNFDWSSRLPFMVRRKALMLAHLPDADLLKRLDRNQEVTFAAIAVLGEDEDHSARLAAAKFGFDADHPVHFWRDGYLLLKPGAAQTFMTNTPVLDPPVLKELALRIPPKRSRATGLVFLRLPFSSKPGDWFEVVAKRGPDAFFYRLYGNSLVRVRDYFVEP